MFLSLLLIERALGRHPKVGKALPALAEQFNYDVLRELLDPSRNGPS